MFKDLLDLAARVAHGLKHHEPRRCFFELPAQRTDARRDLASIGGIFMCSRSETGGEYKSAQRER